MPRPPLPAFAAGFALCLALLAAAARADRLTVFAAASLTDAMAGVAAAWEAETGGVLSIALSGSSALARQVIAGAPADVFVSANPAWMDTVADAGRLVPGTRADLLHNRLVVIAPAGRAEPLMLAELPARLGNGRLAMALVEAVPAGIYGKAALQDLGLWAALHGRVAQAGNVRGALALVAAGEAPFGIVYATDARAESAVATVAAIPENSHPPIVYPAAAITGGNRDGAIAFLAFLRGPQAHAVFAAQGFGLAE